MVGGHMIKMIKMIRTSNKNNKIKIKAKKQQTPTFRIFCSNPGNFKNTYS